MVRLLFSALLLMLLMGACGQGFRDPPSAGAGDHPQPGPDQPVRIVFLGDSITVGGEKPGGYVELIDGALHYLYPQWEIKVMGAGEVGNRVPQLLARFREDVASRRPTHVVVYIGVNDVGRPASGSGVTGLTNFRDYLADLVRRIEAAGAEPIVCTPSVIGEDPVVRTTENLLLDKYAEISREVAAEFGAPVCDLRAAFTSYLSLYNQEGAYEGVLTRDGIHLNAHGHRFVARQILNTLSQELV